jgi:hypothetical protein
MEIDHRHAYKFRMKFYTRHLQTWRRCERFSLHVTYLLYGHGDGGHYICTDGLFMQLLVYSFF